MFIDAARRCREWGDIKMKRPEWRCCKAEGTEKVQEVSRRYLEILHVCEGDIGDEEEVDKKKDR